MLRLSIIVPHQDDDSKLEATILSLLENRTKDHEVIVVHQGGYTDPYRLSDDEIILIEAPRSSTLSEQLNFAVASACAPAVQILFPGTEVDKHWCDAALRALTNASVDCVSVACVTDDGEEVVAGLDRSVLPHRRYANASSRSIAPMLCGSVFRKRVLQLVGGFHPLLSREGVEVELSLLMDAMELNTTHVFEPSIRGSKRSLTGLDTCFETGKACGLIACAYGAVEGSGVTVDSLAKQLGHLAGGLMSPKSVAERLGWVMGVRDRSLVDGIRQRLHDAADRLDQAAEAVSQTSYRRAA